MNGGAKDWERQERESPQAFQAFQIYLNFGVERSTAKVARTLGKSKCLIDRWSSRWKWVARVQSHTNFLTQTATESSRKQATKQGLKILSANQVLFGLSAIADSDIAEVFNEDGTFNLAKAKERGVSKLIKSLTLDKDTGKVTKIECYSAHEGFRDMGKFHKLFTDRIETTSTKEVASEVLREIQDQFNLSPDKARQVVIERFGDVLDRTENTAS